jgi:hypothetical protein
MPITYRLLIRLMRTKAVKVSKGSFFLVKLL